MAAILALVPNVHASIDFFDGTFNLADWQSTKYYWGNGGSITPTQRLSGGNPDKFLEIDHVVATAPIDPYYSSVFGVYLRSGATYDPSIDGAIVSMDFSLDYLNINTTNQGVGFSICLKQDGMTYYADKRLTGTISGWQSSVFPGLQESDFGLVDLNSGFTVDYSQNPDFTVSSSLIELGFCARNSNTSSYNPSYQKVGFDNWAVSIHPVPEPTMFAILALGALVLKKRRKSA